VKDFLHKNIFAALIKVMVHRGRTEGVDLDVISELT